MAMAAKPAYPPLHRHRRKSSQQSPPSPTFPRRPFDRATRQFESYSPIESPSAQSPFSESASADVLSSQSSAQELGHHGLRRPIRLSDDESRACPPLVTDLERPFTSGAIDTKHTMSVGSSTGSSAGGGPNTSFGNKPTPWARHARRASATERGSQEGLRMASNQSPVQSSSPVQSTEKNSPDDPTSTKSVSSKKSRLNLLNPMSLLARRRAAQSQNESELLTINTMHVPALPDNFDPSIRGTITHDFSAPRSRRTPSYDYGHRPDSTPRLTSSHVGDKPSPKQPPSNVSGPTLHSPVFKEHFQDDRPAYNPDQTSSLLNVANRSVSAQQLEASMPEFAKKLPVKLPDHGSGPVEGPSPPELQLPLDLPDPTIELVSLDRSLPDSPSEHPPTPPPKRTPSPKTNLPPATVLPKHMTSTSSRFSFQLGGQASSVQEKLLEEKHKQFQSTKRTSSVAKAENEDELDYDDYDLDAEDVEEAIPEVNFDYDEGEVLASSSDASPIDRPHVEEAQVPYLPQPLHGFDFTPQTLTVSSSSTGQTAHPTPRDPDGFAIGIADGSEPSDLGTADVELGVSTTLEDRSDDKDDAVGPVEGLKINTNTLTDNGVSGSAQTPSATHGHPQIFDDSDLYFDDGEFGDELQPSQEPFDESVLDDETKIRSIPAENARRYEAAIQSREWLGGDGDQVKTARSEQSPGSAKKTRHPDGLLGDGGSEASGCSSVEPKPYTGPGLTEGNLEAYHHALAQAANDAAANGRFSRKVSFDASEDGSQPGLTSDEGRFSYIYGSSRIAEDDGFPFDDDIDDDLMIAEANAEVLENDDEGFYGHEFGFYARAHGKDSSEMVNGGFFATRGSNGVKRSHSGRANFQEPSLTPITERSEWSTRNSVVSLQIPLSAQSLSSAGIAQLLELDSPAHDEDMSLSALMRLRRGAFGNSSTSINNLSPGGHTNSSSSPLHAGPHPFSMPPEHGLSRIGSSVHSMTTTSAGIPESEEEYDDEDGLANDGGVTLTPNTPMKQQKEKANADSSSPVDPSMRSPVPDGSEAKRVYHHSRNSSGADSVSYAREPDGRWILERRRTAEDGGVEVDREYLPAARI